MSDVSDVPPKRLSFHDPPAARNAAFQGRQDILLAMRQRLKPHKAPTHFRAVNLVGPGGAGKTQIALEYAHRYSLCYDDIFWIDAGTLLKADQGFTRLAHALGVADDNMQSLNQTRDLFMETLSQQGRGSKSWLLIFDNVEDPSVLQLLWPQECCGSVIVTSRMTQSPSLFEGLYHYIDVLPFTEKTGTNFLLRTVDQLQEEDQTRAMEVSRALGHLPLALSIAGNYVKALGWDLTRYLESQPDSDGRFVLNDVLRDLNLHGDQTSTSTMWTLNIKRLDPRAQLLMEMLAFTDCNGAQLSLFQRPSQEYLYV